MACGLRTRGHVALPATLCSKPAPYRRRDPTRTPLYQLVTSRLEPFLASREDTCDPKRGYLPPEVRNTYERFLQCGVYGFGTARFSCNACGRDKAVALSCRKRGICARCTAKTLAIWIDQIDTDVLPQINYRRRGRDDPSPTAENRLARVAPRTEPGEQDYCTGLPP